jgi:hypothetical protein
VRPSPTVFISPTQGSYTTDDGTTSGDFSSSTAIGSTFSSDSSSSDDLYNIQNKFPTTYPTENKIPQTIIPSHNVVTIPSNKPTILNRDPQPAHPHHNQRPPTQINSNRPDPHISSLYPIGPDPFPDYFPQPHPPYHFHIDQYDDKNSHFPGIYAHNAPTMHHQNTDRYYAHMDPYGLFPSGRYPDSGINLYNSNRKNGYQVTETIGDVPRGKKGKFYMSFESITNW